MLFSKVVAAMILASMAFGSPLPDPATKTAKKGGTKTKGPKTKTNTMPAVVTTAAVSPEEDSSSANATEGSDGEGIDLPNELPSNPFGNDASPSATICHAMPTHSSNNTSWMEGTTEVRTRVLMTKNNMTIGGLWPEDCPGPADLIVKGLQEICPTREYCQRDSQSTPIVVKARVPDPEHKDRYILRDLDVWIKIHNIFVTMPEPFERLLLLFDEFARATSYWKEEVYDIVDVIGEPKEGGVPFTRTKIKHDWFVTAPTGWEFAINTWAKGGAKKPQALMEVHIMAEWHDDGIAGACEALQQAAGVVEKGLSFVPGGGTFGSVFGSFVGIGCQLGQALEEPAPTPSPC